LAGEKAPEADPSDPAKTRKLWVAWWKDNSAKIDLAKFNPAGALRGLTVIAEHDGGRDGQGRVWECGKDKKQRWVLDTGMGGPLDAQVLPNGHILVAEYTGRRVSERDKTGKVVWFVGVNNSAVSCQRLRNGNTLVATLSQVIEITRDKKQIVLANGSIYYAKRLRNGHTVYTTAAQIVELDAKGKQVRALNVAGINWGSVDKLPNGHYLCGVYSGQKAAEIDNTGKIVWECPVGSATQALRLPNGNTLVSSADGKYVAEFDRNKKEVWRVPTAGRCWRVRRY
jgi:hypothetical protein